MFGVFVERKLSKLLRYSYLYATLPCVNVQRKRLDWQ